MVLLYAIQIDDSDVFRVYEVAIPGNKAKRRFDVQDYGGGRFAKSAAEKFVAEENVKLLLEENKRLRNELRALKVQNKS